jgi:hypothetical protein
MTWTSVNGCSWSHARPGRNPPIRAQPPASRRPHTHGDDSVPLIWDMPVIWTYRRLAFDVLALLSLPQSLTDAAVDPFPKQVGVAAVTGVLLNHVDQYRAQRRATAIRLEALNA